MPEATKLQPQQSCEQRRVINTHIHKEMLKSLIVQHLVCVKVIRYNEEVTDLYIGADINDVLQLTVTTERDIQVINL